MLSNFAGHEAVRAATAKEEVDVRKAQGAYEFARRLQAHMDDLVDRERSSESIFAEDANETEH